METPQTVLSCIIFKSGVSKAIALAWLENKLFEPGLLDLLKNELKNTTLLLLKLLALTEPPQDTYINPNKTTETKPKKNKGFLENPHNLVPFILIKTLLNIFNNVSQIYHFQGP